MKSTLDYKDDIRSTRTGCVGSSDSRMLQNIATLGYVPKSAKKRLAVVKGLIEQEEIPYIDAVRFGDEMENEIFALLSAQDSRYESNPKWVSEKYSRPNVKCLTHPDVILQDDKKKVLRVYEVKTSTHSTAKLKEEYRYQLAHHYLLAQERAKNLGDGWKVKLYLVHYDTTGLDLSQSQAFDNNRLEVTEIRQPAVYDLATAMNIIDKYVAELDEYYEGDEIESTMLPSDVEGEFNAIADVLAEIKERESLVNDFKARLYDFMLSHDIKSIKSPVYSITRVDETITKSFDSRKFLDDYRRQHPRKAKKVIAQFTKETHKKGFVSIKIR